MGVNMVYHIFIIFFLIKKYYFSFYLGIRICLVIRNSIIDMKYGYYRIMNGKELKYNWLVLKSYKNKLLIFIFKVIP